MTQETAGIYIKIHVLRLVVNNVKACMCLCVKGIIMFHTLLTNE